MNVTPEPGSESNDYDTGGIGLIPTFRTLAARFPWIPIVAIVLVFIGLALLALSLSGNNQRPLFPILSTFTPIAGTIEYEPVILGLTELNEDPAVYRGQRIQVSGAFTPVEPPECLNYSGPTVRWSLVAYELQLNAVGFENMVMLLEPDTEMTVTGIWSAFRGPVGCGKEPPDGTVWYLAVDRILEPNPLYGATGPAITVIPGESLPTQLPLGTTEDITPMATPSISGTLPITPTLPLVATQPLPVTPTTNLTPLPVTPLPSAGATAGLTTTPLPGGTAGVTPTTNLSVTPEPTGGTPGTTPPSLPTSTPGGPGYPGQPTPTATTQGGYP